MQLGADLEVLSQVTLDARTATSVGNLSLSQGIWGEADAFGHRKKLSVVEKPKTRRMSHYPWTKVGGQVTATGVNTPKRMAPNLGGVRFNFLEPDFWTASPPVPLTKALFRAASIVAGSRFGQSVMIP